MSTEIMSIRWFATLIILQMREKHAQWMWRNSDHATPRMDTATTARRLAFSWSWTEYVINVFVHNIQSHCNNKLFKNRYLTGCQISTTKSYRFPVICLTIWNCILLSKSNLPAIRFGCHVEVNTRQIGRAWVPFNSIRVEDFPGISTLIQMCRVIKVRWLQCNSRDPSVRHSIFYIIDIQFNSNINILENRIINIECRAWAKNLHYDGSYRDRQGSVHFELMVD